MRKRHIFWLLVICFKMVVLETERKILCLAAEDMARRGGGRENTLRLRADCATGLAARGGRATLPRIPCLPCSGLPADPTPIRSLVCYGRLPASRTDGQTWMAALLLHAPRRPGARSAPGSVRAACMCIRQRGPRQDAAESHLGNASGPGQHWLSPAEPHP